MTPRTRMGPVRTISLRDRCERITVGIASAATHAYRETGVPMIRNKNIKDGHIDVTDLLYLAPEYEQQHRKKRLKAGDVVVVRTGNPGVAAVVPPFLEGAQCFTSLIIRPRQDLLDPDYLCAYINSLAGQRQFSIGAAGGAQKNVNARTLSRMTVPVLSIGSQKAIVNVIHALNSLARTLERLIELKRTFRRGVVRSLLTGQKRFANFSERPWPASKLADHVREIKRRNVDGLSLVLTASGERGLVDQRRYFHRNVAGADLTKYYLLRNGEFAYNRSAMKGYPYGATKRLDAYGEGALSPLYFCFSISDPTLNSDYLKHVLESGLLNRQLRPIVRVGGRAHGLLNVTDAEFLSISIPLPDPDEQQAIADVLNSAEQELAFLRKLRRQIELERRVTLSLLLADDAAGAA